MKSRLLVIASVIVLIMTSAIQAQHGVALNQVIGVTGTDSIQCGQPVSFLIRLTNWDLSYSISGSAHGFRLYSPDGATWIPGLHVDTTILAFPPPGSTTFDTVYYGQWVDPTIPGLVWINPGSGEAAIYDGGIFINTFSVDGQGADTIGFAGFVATTGTGIYQSFNQVSYRIDIDGFDCHGFSQPLTVCIDSSFFPPAGTWKWAGAQISQEEITPWDGPHCFDVFDPSGSAGVPRLTSVTPAAGKQGDHMNVIITGVYTHFQSGSGTAWVHFTQGSSTMNATPINIANDTLLAVTLDIPPTQPLGAYDVSVLTSEDGVITSPSAFTVTTGPPIISANVSELYFGGEANLSLSGARSITVTSSNSFTNIAVGKKSAWLQLSPTSGQAPFTFTASLTGFRPAGQYVDTIVIAAQEGGNIIRIPVHLGVLETASMNSLSLDHIVGGVGTDSIYAGEPVTFHIRYTGGLTQYDGIVNGFELSSPDGAQWSGTGIDTTGALGKKQFDLGVFLASFSNNGAGADTTGLGAVAIAGPGLYPGFDDIVLKISIGPIDSSYIGKTICLDSSWLPPAGNWSWMPVAGGGVFPKWDGPHCLKIVGRTSPPPPVTPDVAITSVNGGPIDSVTILPCGKPITFTVRGHNPYTSAVFGLANGFEISSPDGATWQPSMFIDTNRIPWDTSYYAQWIDPATMPGVSWNNAFNTQIFDGGLFNVTRSMTGSNADTIGLAGFVLTTGIGIPVGFDDIMWTIKLDQIDCQTQANTICIDSSFFPPSGTWKWSLDGGPIDGIIPTFSGGKCFPVSYNAPGSNPPLSPMTFEDTPADRVPLTDYGNVTWDHPDQYGFAPYNTTNATPYDGQTYVLNSHGKNMIGFGPPNTLEYLNGAFFAKCTRSNAVPIGEPGSYPVDSIRFHFYPNTGGDSVSAWYPLKKIPTWIPIERNVSHIVIEHDTAGALDNFFQNVPDAKWFAMDHVVWNMPMGYEPPSYCEDFNNNDICDNLEPTMDSTNVRVDYVDGMWNNGTVIAGRVLEFGIRITNLTSENYLGIANGFRVYSPDGASWSQTVPDTTGKLESDSMMNAGVFVVPINTDGIGADTVGFAGVAIPFSPKFGLHPGYSEVAYTIQIGPISASDAGKTICLDSSYFPPAGHWLWSSDLTDYHPTWGGPYCFTIYDAGTPVLPTIACPPDTVTAIAGYNYEFSYTPTINNAETVIVSGPAEANARWVNGSVVVDGPAQSVVTTYPITIIAKNVFGSDTCHISLRVVPFIFECMATHYTTYTITGLPYNVLVDPNLILNCQLNIGDEIGVFDAAQDLLVGGVAYCEPGVPMTLTAWKGDPNHGLSGYVPGNPIEFRVFKPGPDSLGGIELCTDVFGVGVDHFESSTYGHLDSMRCRPCEETFCFPVTSGRWHTVSSPVLFSDPAASVVFETLEGLDIAQDDDGRVYIPGVANTMSPVNPMKAMDVFVEGGTDDWCVTGMPIRGAAMRLRHGRWNGLGYPVTCPIPVDVAMAGVLECIEIVQDDNGRVFIPSIPYNTIGDMIPGQGYKVFLSCNTDTLFTYPMCGFGPPPPKANQYQVSQPAAKALHYTCAETGLPYVVLLQNFNDANLEPGTELGLFDAGLCVGGATYNGEDILGVTSWRADQQHGLSGFTPGAEMEIRARAVDGTERTLVSAGKGYRFDDGSYGILSLGEIVKLPTSYALDQNYPNPFNPTTTIGFSLPTAGHVTITVYNVLGQSVRTLVDKPLEGGQHSVEWDGRDNNAQRVSSGLYLYRMSVAGHVLTRKALLLK